MKSIIVAAAALFAGAAAAGVGELPGHTLDAPGSKTVGAPQSTAATSTLYVDANGDGLIQRAEVKPGTQLAKRFDARDTNHDGALSANEYVVVP